MMKLYRPFFFFLILFVQRSHAQDLSLYQKKQFTQSGQILQYRILYPLNYDSTVSYPLVVFLHGSGNIGTDNNSQLQHGASLFLADSNRRQFPAIILFPQCPPGQEWSYFKFNYDSTNRKMFLTFPFNEKQPLASKLLKALIDSLSARHIVDSKRRYLGGLSLGGFGTFDLIERFPGYFAAAFPMCGGGDTTRVADVARSKTPLWIFHGEKDPIVNVSNSRDFYQAMLRAHGNVRYTEYPGIKHNCWDYAFKEPALLSWLFAKSRATSTYQNQ